MFKLKENIMKSFLLVISFLFYYSSFCQTKVVKNDVVIVYFNNDSNTTSKYTTRASKTDSNKDNIIYTFWFNKVDKIELNFREFNNFDEMEKNNPELYFYVNKTFLRKNKDIILTYEKMLKLGYEKSFNWLNNANHILLIDKDESIDKKIIIKKVYHFFLNSE